MRMYSGKKVEHIETAGEVRGRALGHGRRRSRDRRARRRSRRKGGRPRERDGTPCGARRIGDVVLKLDHISLAFGGVKALTDISFDVREHEVRAIIGPNGAGKSSMLNVINGVYRPQQGTITFRGKERRGHGHARRRGARHRAHVPEHRAVPRHGVLDNIMTGRNLKMKATLPRAGDLVGPRAARGARAPAQGRGSDRLPRDPAHPQDAGRAACRTACRSASSSRARSPPSRRCCCSTSRWRA